MNTYWVLVAVVWMYNGGGPVTAEFSSKERCEIAAAALNASVNGWTAHVRATCVLK